VNPDVFSTWLRGQGHHVVRTASSYWHDRGPRAYQAFPYHWVVNIPRSELDDFFSQTGAIGLRYSTPVEAPNGKISYHAVYEDSYYDMGVLGKWSRKNVRRGLARCTVEPISFQRLIEDGWHLQVDTLDRQGRDVTVTKQMWHRRWHLAAELPGFQAWGALIDGQLAASVVTFLMNDCAYMLDQQCLRNWLPMHVNNALSFVVTQNMVRHSQAASILYGLHSLDAPPTVDEFKFRMGYEAKPVRQRAVFHPRLAVLFNRFSHAALIQARRWRPSSPTLAKAEGMVRFYLEGRRPLSQQTWPQGLADQQATLLHS
jgi:hypothetical protein